MMLIRMEVVIGKVESEFLLFNDDIPGKFADPWNLLANQKKNTYGDDKNTKRISIFPKAPNPNI